MVFPEMLGSVAVIVNFCQDVVKAFVLVAVTTSDEPPLPKL